MPILFGLTRARLIAYGAIALLVLGLFAHDRIQTERASRYKSEAKSLQSQLSDLAAKSKAKQAETARKIDRIVKRDDSEARRIEAAPLPGNCRTPDIIMGADL